MGAGKRPDAAAPGGQAPQGAGAGVGPGGGGGGTPDAPQASGGGAATARDLDLDLDDDPGYEPYDYLPAAWEPSPPPVPPTP